MKVVLVHGFLESGRIMGKLARYLSEEGHECLTPSLKPCDGKDGLPKLARELHDFLEKELAEGERFAMAGFSMGSLVSRYYLQELAGHLRVDAFFSISGPHSGTWMAYFYPSDGVRQMRPGSRFLQDLDASSERLAEIPITCYWTPFDLMIIPAASCRWPMGEEMLIPSLIHRWMVSDRRLHQDISERLGKVQSRGELGNSES